jgi:hypothetical protein
MKLTNILSVSALSNDPHASTACSGNYEVDECWSGGGNSMATVQDTRRLQMMSVLHGRNEADWAVRIGFRASDLGSPYRLEVYDVAGRKQSTLASGSVSSGAEGLAIRQSLTPHDMRAGLYFLRLRVGSQTETRRFVVVP